MYHFLRIAAALLALFAIQTAFAQRMGNSPYSQIGIGELVYPGYAPNVAMGGVGAAYTNGIFINNVNPALLFRNRSTTFDIGFAGGWKQIQTNQTSQRDFNLNLNYLSLAFPASKRWTLGLNLAPFSSVNYDIASRGTVTGSNDQAQYTSRGLGGLNAVSFTNGINLYKGLSIGLQTSYIFGSITKEFVSQLVNDTTGGGYNVASVRRTNYSNFIFKPGIAYRHKLNDRVFWNVGATYDLPKNLQGNELSTIQYRAVSDGDALPGAVDTLSNRTSGTVRLPAGYQFGISFDQPLRWALAADVSYRNWSDVQGDANISLRNAMTFSLGGEWTPDVNSLNSYLKRTTYRLGFNYAQMPITSQGTQLKDMSIRAGIFLPITPPDRRSLSYLNLAVSAGQRGTLNNSLIRERYINLVLGFTINDFGWFIKPKID